MDNVTLQKILDESAKDRFEPDRRYLGMSAIGGCPLRLWREMTYGRETPDAQGMRYFNEGYLHEGDVVARLVKAGVKIGSRQARLVAPFDERFAGHIDGSLDGKLIEIKSVNEGRFTQVEIGGKPLREHAAQCQIYMRYGGYAAALVIYKERYKGRICVVELARDEAEGERLERKAKEILHLVDTGVEPACTCGWCR
jgi:hypothetical protein